MNTSPPISVVIVTKNRLIDLLECLSTIITQLTDNDELIVINNNSEDHTHKLLVNLAKSTYISFRYVLEKRLGYPVIYNKGLQESKNNWVAFIDDDCIADKDWLLWLKKAIRQNIHAHAVIGETKTYFQTNVFSLLIHFFNSMWKKNGRIGKKVVNFATLDNRNIAYKKSFLQKKNLMFNEERSHFLNGAAEDVELGLHIGKEHGRAIYEQKMLAWHKDPTTFQQCLQKMDFADRAASLLSIPDSKKEVYRVRNYFIDFCKENELSFLLSVQLFVLMCLVVLRKKMKIGV